MRKGELIDEGIIQKNKDYISTQRKKLYSTKNDDLFTYMLQNKIIPLKEIEGLIEEYGETKNTARVAALLEYKEKAFTAEEKEKQFNKQFELKEPSSKKK